MQSLSAAPRNAPRGAPRPTSRRDPAPSLWAYRTQRWMLTPIFRAFLFRGLPLLLALAAGAVWLGQEPNRAALAARLTELRQQFESRPEFQVGLVRVDGASQDLVGAVRAKLGLTLPMSSFDIDLEAVRARVETLDAVKSADLRVRAGGVLEVAVTERVPVAIWRSADGLTLIDDQGHRVAGLISRSDRPDLPVIAGEGADRAAAEAMALVAAAGPLIPRLRGLVRMGERRWDIVLDRDQRIQLPETNPVEALERLLALDHAQDLLSRDILTVDLRSDRRPTLRQTPHALAEARRAQGVETVESEP